MKRMRTKILCTGFLFLLAWIPLRSQDRTFRIGFQTSPVISWVKTNDPLILRNGGNFGLKLGATGDLFLSENLALTFGLNLAFHEGGEFLFEIGGNYLPNAELSIPDLQTGDKPLPDKTRIRYKMQYVDIPFGIKWMTPEARNARFFVEAPMLSLSFLTRGRGDIRLPGQTFSQENIRKDLSFLNLFWGLGAGVEYPISQNNVLIGGLYLQKGMIDFTRDKGYRAIPNPDFYPPYLREQEDSRATVSNLVIRLGIIF